MPDIRAFASLSGRRTLTFTWALGLALIPGLAPAAAVADSLCGGLLPVGLLTPVGGFTNGCSRTFTLKLGAALGPSGNYILIDYPSCPSGPCAGLTGVQQMQCAAQSGYACCASTGQSVLTIQGTNVGLFAGGLAQRFTDDADGRPGICYAAYGGNGARVVNVAIADFPGGDRSQMILSSFATVFLRSPPAGSGQSTTWTVEFIAQGVTPARATSWGRIKLLYR